MLVRFGLFASLHAIQQRPQLSPGAMATPWQRHPEPRGLSIRIAALARFRFAARSCLWRRLLLLVLLLPLPLGEEALLADRKWRQQQK